MNEASFEAGQQVRLKHDPSRVGVVTNRTRARGGIRRLQVRFADGAQYVPEDQLEGIGSEGDDPLDLLKRGRLGDAADLRRAVTHARLTGRLADVIYSMDTTGTDFYAHQFKPIVKLMNSATRGILIADEVGLGKTIEAGLLWTELRTRFDFRRLLVLCPAMLREKWQRELRQRFGVTADVLDAGGTLDRLRQAAQDGPAASFAVVASLQGLRPHKGWNEGDPGQPGGESSRLARFMDERNENDPLVDLCIIDEAHYLRNRETMTSVLGRLVRSISDFIVLLSATPIHLKSGDLYELLRLLDENTFQRQQSFDDILEANGALVRVRQLILDSGGRPDSETRAGVERELLHAREHRLLAGSRQLAALISEQVWREDLMQPDVRARLAERLDRVNLLGHVVTRTRKRDVQERRVVRVVNALDVTLNEPERAFYDAVTNLVRRYCMQRGGHEGFLLTMPQRQMCSSMPAALQSWGQGGAADEDEDSEDADEHDRPLRAELTARAAELGDLAALWRQDSKYQKLREQLRSLFRQEPSTKVVVFSYFRATLRYLHQRLDADGIRSITMHGGHADKNEIMDEFRESPDLDVLLSSEVGSEGIDLQFARVVINYDLPWNPMRVEQRIGRIDRLGQPAEKIHVWNLFYQDTIDDRIYHRLFERLHVFEGALGGLETVLGDRIQELTQALFSERLTPEEESRRIDQTALALENRQLEEVRLEHEATHLTAYGDYILRQVKAARELHRSISAQDLRSYVTDYFDIHYTGSEFRQVPDDATRFDISLSVDARRDFAAYLRKLRMTVQTRLAGDTVRHVRCWFENTAVPNPGGREEVISQFHPLVRFVSERLSAPDEQRRPAVAMRVAAQHLAGVCAPDLYAFSVQRWSVRGLRDMERLDYAAAPQGDGLSPLDPPAAERLIATAVNRGTAWSGARGAMELGEIAEFVDEVCLAQSESRFEQYVKDLDAENADRANVQERMLDEHYRTQRSRLEELLDRYRREGRAHMVPPTEGRLRALDSRTERRRRDIDDRRELQYSTPEPVCVGIIEVTAAGGREP